VELIRINQEGEVIEQSMQCICWVESLIQEADIVQINCRIGLFDVSKRQLRDAVKERAGRIEKIQMRHDHTTGKTILRAFQAVYR